MQSFYIPHSPVTLDCGDEQITKQSFKAECDINNILRQYTKTGVINHVQSSRPTYQDLPDAIDYQESMNTLLAADAAFAGLPASVRSRFGNDPGEFLAALSDPEQTAYLTEVGVFRAADAASALPDPVRPPAPASE
ncbi:MAG: internal scaffolding protein [Microviridae sp.]|nr:MAG: internal scaffolding protein [Microviridae sp.]